MSEARPSLAQPETTEQPQDVQQEVIDVKPVLTPEEQEDILGDKDLNVRDLILLIFDMHEAKSSILKKKVERGFDHLKICQLGLVNVVVP